MAETPLAKKRPSFQWYPGDWQRDTALRACSLEARGLWIEMLNLMHDGEPYGHLTAGGVPLDTGNLARMVGVSGKRCTVLLAELEAHGVLSRNVAGVIYSRRMVKDEHNRLVRAKGGKDSLNHPNVPQPKDGGKDTFGPSFGGSPATASTAVASAFAETPEQVAEARIRFCAAANKGLAEHPHRPQSVPRVLPNSGGAVHATETILATGMPVGFAEAEIYRIAGNHSAEDWITSLNYFVAGASRAWQQHEAGIASANASPARHAQRTRRQQNPGAQQVANIKQFLTGTDD